MSNNYVQAVLFNNEIYTALSARRWLKRHNFEPIKKVDKTTRFLRYRIVEPNDKDIYRFKHITDDIHFIIGIRV